MPSHYSNASIARKSFFNKAQNNAPVNRVHSLSAYIAQKCDTHTDMGFSSTEFGDNLTIMAHDCYCTCPPSIFHSHILGFYPQSPSSAPSPNLSPQNKFPSNLSLPCAMTCLLLSNSLLLSPFLSLPSDCNLELYQNKLINPPYRVPAPPPQGLPFPQPHTKSVKNVLLEYMVWQKITSDCPVHP